MNGLDNYNKKLVQNAQIGREQYYCDLLIRHNIGGIERHTGRMFCVSLGLGGSRSMPNLEPLIKKHIRRGSIIMSDCWPADNNISNLVDVDGASMDRCHYTVNHSVSFVNPSNRWVHSQTVERFWGDLKDHISGRGKGLKIKQNVFRSLFLKKNKIN